MTAVDKRDHYTRKHSEDVTEYSLMIARELGLDRVPVIATDRWAARALAGRAQPVPSAVDLDPGRHDLRLDHGHGEGLRVDGGEQLRLYPLGVDGEAVPVRRGVRSARAS